MKKEDNRRHVYVFAHWCGMEKAMLMGILHTELLRGKEIFSFEYDEHWLQSAHAQALDPDLQLYTGMHYLNDENKKNFGLFLDSSPDRWGRRLMDRREAAIARKNNTALKNLFETDYLLGVFDGQRMGALRFKVELDGPFLNDNKEMATPPWASIRELEAISLRLEEDDIIDDPEYMKWLTMLVNPGSSLGGARPKAGIVDTDGSLWIAKFPSSHDDSDMGAWEILTHELAIASGINMAECQARKFSTPHHTFLTKRFDRNANNERIHFASAMTLLGYTDGQDHHDGASYLELVEFIMRSGANVNADLEQLWRRIVFSICVSNTDDHLRNHGFLLTAEGWALSPAYDINPVETGTGLKLNISETDNELSLGLARQVRGHFRVEEQHGEQIIKEVLESVSNWEELANKYGISRAGQELKAAAFQRGFVR